MWKPIREEGDEKRAKQHGHLLPPGIWHKELLVLHQPRPGAGRQAQATAVRPEVKWLKGRVQVLC